MGKITDRVEKAFTKFKEESKNKIENLKAIENFVNELIDVADKNVKFQHHRDILDNEVERQFQLIKEE